jgi:hemolysin activation/secretion protein
MIKPFTTLALCCALVLGGRALAQNAPVAAPKFDIQRFAVSGNTLLAEDEVEGVVRPYTGKQKSFEDIQRALRALESAYRERGYGVVQVTLPEQDITHGVVRFVVMQPRIDKVTVSGNVHFDSDNIRRSLPTVQEGRTPNSKNIARNLQMLSEHPIKQTKVLLRAGKTQNDVDVNVKVMDDKPWRAVLSLDNTGTSDTGYLRSGIGFQHTNLFNRDQTLTAQYITSPTDQSKVNIYGIGYRVPFYNLNSSLDLVAGHSDVSSGNVQGLFSVSGSGDILGARWNYFLPHWGDFEQKLGLGLEYRVFKNSVLFAGFNLVPDVTIHPASVTYSAALHRAEAEFGFYGSISTNIPGGNDGEDADFQRSRTNASANYTIFRYGLNFARLFQNDWRARAAFMGQYTTDSLVSGEQFGLGGPDSVRGYLLREIVNDRGYSGQLELYTPDLATQIGISDQYHARLLAFYDFGSVQRNNPLPGEVANQSISSIGLGVRFSYAKNVSLVFDVAQILKAAGTRTSSDQRISSSLSVLF